ncbi:MAG: DUF721 domain-containing protein [Bacteroidota bacterium]
MKKHNDKRIDEVLKDLVGGYKHKSKLYKNKLSVTWENTMGTTIAKYTSRISVRNKKLFITIDSASLRQELSFSKDKIRKVMNEELGEDYIEEVVIR